ncbi:MAG: bifunctional precorrin-2 dehydrogenase/sirohydrochlorin ferrochelatase [bacterium]|nr:bifunctional precorrin-2 dehydrogenase/sirohydrochlorin ferrochelatase [bacterium]
MKFLPIGLNIEDKKIMIVGGGNTALQKIKQLRNFTSSISVVALKVSPEIKHTGIPFIEKAYSCSDLEGTDLIYACTNNKDLNRQIRSDAAKRHVLINVVDDIELSDFISPAVYKKANMTVSVSSDGKNVLKSIKWRDKIKKIFNDKADK